MDEISQTKSWKFQILLYTTECDMISEVGSRWFFGGGLTWPNLVTCRGIVLRTLLVGLKGFTGSLPIPNLTFCSDFGSSAQSQGFLRSDLVEEIRHLAFYNAGMSNIRIVTSVIGRAQRSIGRASALPGLYKTTPVVTWPLVTWTWNFQESCGPVVQTAMQKKLQIEGWSTPPPQLGAG